MNRRGFLAGRWPTDRRRSNVKSDRGSFKRYDDGAGKVVSLFAPPLPGTSSMPYGRKV